jgi:hypothetical protein
LRVRVSYPCTQIGRIITAHRFSFWGFVKDIIYQEDAQNVKEPLELKRVLSTKPPPVANDKLNIAFLFRIGTFQLFQSKMIVKLNEIPMRVIQ